METFEGQVRFSSQERRLGIAAAQLQVPGLSCDTERNVNNVKTP